MNEFESPDYKRSRKAYVTQCTIEHLLGLLVVDAYLAKLLTYIGLSDAVIGVIASFVSIAFVFQILSVFLVKSKLSTKKSVMISDCLSQFCFMLLYFIPFLPIPDFAKRILAILSIVLAYGGKYLVITLYFKWANEYVHPEKRGVFSANKECISLICGIVFATVMGYVIDAFDKQKNLEGGFLVIAITMLVINLINYICLKMIREEDKKEQEAMRMSFGEVLGYIKTNSTFIAYVAISSGSNFANGLLNGFIGVYKINDLLMPIFTIQLINILADFLRLIVSKPFGKFSDKYGFAKGIELASMLSILAFTSIIFTTPKTWYMVTVYTMLLVASNAGSYQNGFNISYQMLPNNYITQAMAIKSVFSGGFSFLGALIGGFILSSIQAGGNMVFGIHIYGQQVLAVIAVLVRILTIALFHIFVVNALKKKEYA